MTPSVAALYLLGPLSLGFPEMLVLTTVAALFLGLPALIVVGVVRASRRKPTRYCTHCGRGLAQPMEASFCCYCGQKLP